MLTFPRAQGQEVQTASYPNRLHTQVCVSDPQNGCVFVSVLLAHRGACLPGLHEDPKYKWTGQHHVWRTYVVAISRDWPQKPRALDRSTVLCAQRSSSQLVYTF